MLDSSWTKDTNYNLVITRVVKIKEGKLLGTGTRTRGNVFQLNTTKITCLVAKIDNSWLWHRRFCDINFDHIVKVSKTSIVRDLHKITMPTDIVCKECILVK